MARVQVRLEYKNVSFVTVWVEFPCTEPHMRTQKTAAVIGDLPGVIAYLDCAYSDIRLLLPPINSGDAKGSCPTKPTSPHPPPSPCLLRPSPSSPSPSPPWPPLPYMLSLVRACVMPSQPYYKPRRKKNSGTKGFASVEWSGENRKALEDAWGVVVPPRPHTHTRTLHTRRAAQFHPAPLAPYE
ncbi:hypothetical protein BV22DRAFT_1134059 [Leucogyrophana mollusca]|uniref:Uncharacterized protein n=1 Tax=Leucogyrophana mollusca TaxID=85980 RepID=A0ACB8B1N3_9AGAM|nr:hypothetical protein BV22DRAFT_1134059 [Leucogyrophana mollusca]